MDFGERENKIALQKLIRKIKSNSFDPFLLEYEILEWKYTENTKNNLSVTEKYYDKKRGYKFYFFDKNIHFNIEMLEFLKLEKVILDTNLFYPSIDFCESVEKYKDFNLLSSYGNFLILDMVLLENLLWNNNANNNVEKENTKVTTWLKIKWYTIVNCNWEIVYTLNKIEKIILKNILIKTDDWWISRENLIKLTKQTKNAFNQYLKTMRKSIREKWLKDKIIIKYDFNEKTYKAFLS